MADRRGLFMVVAYLAGVGMLVYELQGAPSPPPPPAPAPAVKALPPVELPPAAINSIAIYDTIVERPLFNAERRPDEPDATAPETVSAAGPVDEIDGYRLTAVIKGYGSTTVLIEDSAGNTQTRHAGEMIGKWEVQEIQDDRVVLLSDTRRETLLVHQFDPVMLDKPAASRPGARPPARRPRRPPVALLPSPDPSPDKPNP